MAVLDIDPRMQRMVIGEGVSPRAAGATPDPLAAPPTALEAAAEGLDASGATEDIVMSEDDTGAKPESGLEAVADGMGGGDVAGGPVAVENIPAPSPAAAIMPEPALDFTAFQFAAPSSTTRIGALPTLTIPIPKSKPLQVSILWPAM